jgi:hypothetical protein
MGSSIHCGLLASLAQAKEGSTVEGDGIPAILLAYTFLEQLVNHNGGPPPCFLKSVDFKGTLSCFRMNTFESADSAWFIEALSLEKSKS